MHTDIRSKYKKLFYTWLYISHYNSKFTLEARQGNPYTSILMRDWYNHVDLDAFVTEASMRQYNPITAREVAEEICAQKKMEALLDAS